MKATLSLFLLMGVLVFSAWGAETGKNLINVDRQGVALQKYDPVAYFTDHHPVQGNAAYTASYQGATYYFVSAEHKALFESHPEQYAPQFGGYCAYGVSHGATAPITVSAFQIIEGKLYLQYDEDILHTFNQDPQGNLSKAKKNWPQLVEEKGK